MKNKDVKVLLQREIEEIALENNIAAEKVILSVSWMAIFKDIRFFRRKPGVFTETVRNQKGMGLVVAMLILVALTAIGMVAINTTAVDTAVSGNTKDAKQAFYTADAGISHAGDFLSGRNTTQWAGYAALQNIAVNQPIGTGSYTVTVQDGGNDRRKVVSTGTTGTGATAQIAAVFAQAGLLNPPGALYVNSDTTVSGGNAEIIGDNDCAGGLNPLAGIGTTSSSSSSITQNGHPDIAGNPAIQTGTQVIDVRAIITARQPSANYSYAYTSNQTDNGMDWGTPTGNPAVCSVSNTVYYNMNTTNTLRLSGNSHGCGILMVDGDLTLSNGFQWYGVIIVTGSITTTGNGNIVTGAIMAGGASSSNSIGNGTSLQYCSVVISGLNNSLPARALTWRQVF